MDQAVAEATKQIERELLDRVFEIHIFYGREFLAGDDLPVAGTPFWAWVCKLLVREYKALHPEVREICGYGSNELE